MLLNDCSVQVGGSSQWGWGPSEGPGDERKRAAGPEGSPPVNSSGASCLARRTEHFLGTLQIYRGGQVVESRGWKNALIWASVHTKRLRRCSKRTANRSYPADRNAVIYEAG